MQHLLDFIHEHTLEEQLYLTAPSSAGDLELIWQRRVAPDYWQVRPSACEGPAELVRQRDLLSALSARRVDMLKVERELQSIVVTQIAFADMVLRDASALLGSDGVRRAVQGHRVFMSDIQTAVERLVDPSAQCRATISVVAGGGQESAARSGHLRLLPQE